jgi:HNH endonuclease
MSSYVSAELRRLIEDRAGGACEYCLIHARDTYYGCQVDHVIAEKHGGLTELNNLAFACAICNRAKGSDIGSYVPGTQRLVRFFNQRTDRWEEHFRLNARSLLIDPLTDIGAVTVQLLGFNDIERILERQTLVQIGHYPVARLRPR